MPLYRTYRFGAAEPVAEPLPKTQEKSLVVRWLQKWLPIFDRRFENTREFIQKWTARKLHAVGKAKGTKSRIYNQLWRAWFRLQKQYNAIRAADQRTKQRLINEAKAEPGAMTVHRRVLEGVGPYDVRVQGLGAVATATVVGIVAATLAVAALIAWGGDLLNYIMAERQLRKKAELVKAVAEGVAAGTITPEAGEQRLKESGVFELPGTVPGAAPIPAKPKPTMPPYTWPQPKRTGEFRGAMALAIAALAAGALWRWFRKGGGRK